MNILDKLIENLNPYNEYNFFRVFLIIILISAFIVFIKSYKNKNYKTKKLLYEFICLFIILLFDVYLNIAALFVGYFGISSIFSIYKDSWFYFDPISNIFFGFFILGIFLGFCYFLNFILLLTILKIFIKNKKTFLKIQLLITSFFLIIALPLYMIV